MRTKFLNYVFLNGLFIWIFLMPIAFRSLTELLNIPIVYPDASFLRGYFDSMMIWWFLNLIAYNLYSIMYKAYKKKSLPRVATHTEIRDKYDDIYLP